MSIKLFNVEYMYKTNFEFVLFLEYINTYNFNIFAYYVHSHTFLYIRISHKCINIQLSLSNNNYTIKLVLSYNYC